MTEKSIIERLRKYKNILDSTALEAADTIEAQQAEIDKLRKQVAALYKEGVEAATIASERIEAQQARIAELRDALSKYLNVMYEEDYAAKALARIDDAIVDGSHTKVLAAHDADKDNRIAELEALLHDEIAHRGLAIELERTEVRKAALLEAADNGEFGPNSYLVRVELRRMAEGGK